MSAPTSPGLDLLLDGRYRVEELIARGGMATVHRGHDQRLDRVVALKIMHPHLAMDEEFRRRFAREARAAARLAHRNVVGVFDQGEDGERIYLAMELVAVRRGDPVVRSVPADLLLDGDIAPHLGGTITVLRDGGFEDEELLRWLFTEDETLPGRPIDHLRRGQRGEVRRRAQALAF